MEERRKAAASYMLIFITLKIAEGKDRFSSKSNKGLRNGLTPAQERR